MVHRAVVIVGFFSLAGCDGRPEPVVLAAGQGDSGEIAIDDTSVYWTEYNHGLVKKVLLGGGVVEVVVEGQGGVEAVTVDRTSSYWTDVTGGRIMKIAKL
jgi:hypothetical protein